MPTTAAPIHREAPIERSPARAVLGLLVVAVGVIALVEDLSGFEVLALVDYFWPLLLATAGTWKVVAPGSPASRVTGLVLAGWGGLWLLGELRLLPFDVGELWPLLLVLLGGVLFWQATVARRAARTADGSTVDAVAFMGGVGRSSSAADFRGGDLVAVMGGCEVDLREAHIAGGRAVIDAFVLWGGVEIHVPPRWRVRLAGLPILAGFDDKTGRAGEATEPVEGELVVKGLAIMGAVVILP